MVKCELPPCVDGWSHDKMGEWEDKFQDLSPMLNADYFVNVHTNQREFIWSVVKRLHLENKHLVSIGVGSGAEEILFKTFGLETVTCIEPDSTCADLINTRKYEFGYTDENFIVENCWKEDIRSPIKFDCIYTCSPSDWMYFYTIEEGIPDSYLDFVREHASSQCYLVFRTYGAKYSKNIIDSKNLNIQKIIKMMMWQLHSIDFKLIEFWFDVAQPHGAVIVASNFDEKIDDDYGMLGVAYRHQRIVQPNLVYKK